MKELQNIITLAAAASFLPSKIPLPEKDAA
jgi:hypothetical protein